MLKNSLFYSKILLFGEYGIIEDSMGLSIPFHFYKGKMLKPLTPPTAEQIESNNNLKAYFKYLKESEKQGVLPCKLDLDKLENDIENGLYFDSSIPQGFGVGSSGAGVADRSVK